MKHQEVPGTRSRMWRQELPERWTTWQDDPRQASFSWSGVRPTAEGRASVARMSGRLHGVDGTAPLKGAETGLLVTRQANKAFDCLTSTPTGLTNWCRVALHTVDEANLWSVNIKSGAGLARVLVFLDRLSSRPPTAHNSDLLSLSAQLLDTFSQRRQLGCKMHWCHKRVWLWCIAGLLLQRNETCLFTSEKGFLVAQFFLRFNDRLLCFHHFCPHALDALLGPW